MLKAIGKSINIRVSGIESTKIPIVILGNSPITDSYTKKVDFLKQSGVIQGFWSLNPQPTDKKHVRHSPQLGFETIINEKQLLENCKRILVSDLNYFSTMISKSTLGSIIKIASQERDDIARAEKFLYLIRS